MTWRPTPGRSNRDARNDERSRDRRDALASAREAEGIGRRGRDAHGRAEDAGEERLRLGPTRRELRSVADDLQRDVAHGEARLAHTTQRLGEEHLAVRALEAGIARAEHAAHVAQPGGREQGVADRMARGIAVAA